MFLVYKVGRAVADGHVGRAYANAVRIWHWERVLALPSEADVQRLLMSSHALIRAANVYYAWLHFTAMIIFLLWIYLFRPAHYVPLRRLVATVTGIALVVHLTFPLAPPRLSPGPHLIDTATVFGPSVYGPPSDDSLTNQYAAMPSLHVGWALIIAIGLIRTSRGRWRFAWLLYPACTFAVVVGTANHYWLDGLVAIVIVAIVVQVPLVRGRHSPAAAAQIPSQRGRGDQPAAGVPAARLSPDPLSPSPDASPRADLDRRACPHTALSRRLHGAQRGPADIDRDTVRSPAATRVRPPCAAASAQIGRGRSGQRPSARSPVLPRPSDRHGAADDRTGG
jgi:hypothetical protein